MRMDAAADLEIRKIANADDPVLEAVIGLGDANRKTLGFLPRAGYVEAAASQSIVLATTGGDISGYCLFQRSGQFVRIVHLCVSSQHRGLGVARRLVHRVETLNSDASGIRLKCRRDWPAASLWPVLGFQPMNEVPGRSRAGLPLTIWWKPLSSEPDLFTAIEEPDDIPVTVALDSNVFSDLHCEESPERRTLAAPVALMSGDQRIRLVVPHCAVDEVNQISDPRRRRRLLSAQHRYPSVLEHSLDAERIRVRLLELLDSAVLRADESLLKDTWLVAESIAADCDVFLTRDESAIQRLGPVSLDTFGLAMMLPSELPDHVYRRQASGDYAPAHLANTGISTQRDVARFWSVGAFDRLLNREGGERKVAFRERLRAIAEQSGQGRLARFVAVSPDGEVVAAWAYTYPSNSRGGAVQVPLVRVAAGPLARTLARQILFSIRRDSARAGEVVLTDPTLSPDVTHVLSAECFVEQSDRTDFCWRCVVLDEVDSWSTVGPLIDAAGLPALQRPSVLTAPIASELERRLWPLKITDAPLRSYVIPIRGPFADELLGHAPTLVPRDITLGLSRENVYYRSPSGQPRAPARILWYSSGRDRQIVACSRLVESLIGEPDALHREFKRLGVWDRTQVREAARSGRVGAIRFSDTEVLAHPVELDWIRGLSDEGARLIVRWPSEVSGQLFTAIYMKGRRG